MAKVIITRGRPYDLTVDVKQPDSPTSASIPSDAVGTFYLIDKETNSQLIVKTMTRVDDDPTDPDDDPKSARFRLILDETETANLPFDFNYFEDGSKPVDTCRGHIAIDSPNSVDEEIKFADAIIPSIYIADIGL